MIAETESFQDKLIAAAPGLLNALLSVVAAFEEYGQWAETETSAFSDAKELMGTLIKYEKGVKK